jgi:RHS repeat-associated protein
MQMKERTFAAEDYTYGFNGQEQDTELLGGAVSFKYRIHDPRIGRFLSVDPLAPEYPWYTPYQFAGNKVIAHSELEGLEEKLDISPDESIYFKEDDYVSNKAHFWGLNANGEWERYTTDITEITASRIEKVKNEESGLTLSETVSAVGKGIDNVITMLAPVRPMTPEETLQFQSVGYLNYYKNLPKNLYEGVTSIPAHYNSVYTGDDTGQKITTTIETVGLAFSILKGGSPKNVSGVVMNGASWPFKTKARISTLTSQGSRCVDWANDICNAIGGEIRIVANGSSPGQARIGPIKHPNGKQIVDNSNSWFYHYMVIKDGRVYDRMTGSNGMSLTEYSKLFEYWEDLKLIIPE